MPTANALRRSAIMGILYDVSIPSLMLFSVVSQLVAVPIVLRVRRETAVTS